MSGLGEGVPGDVEPAVAGQQLVGVVAFLQEFHQPLELLRVFRADIGRLTKQVLRVLHAPNLTIDVGITETRINDDRAYLYSCRLQQHMAAVSHINDMLRRRLVARILQGVQKFLQLKVSR